MSITCVIPTYNGQKLLEKHLPAVEKALRPGDELLIADDASTDDTLSWLSKRYSLQEKNPELTQKDVITVFSGHVTSTSAEQIQVTVMRNVKNRRFAATCNEAVIIAQHNYILLLNNDVEPNKDIQEKLLEHFTDASIFGVGCMEDEHGVKGGKNKLWFERGLYRHNRADEFTTGETAWVSGGSGMFDRQKWLELRGFDLAYYPAYWEDVDLSFRARKKGWKVLFDAEAQVQHLHESTNADVFGQQKMQEMSWKHGLYFTWKNANIFQRIQFLLWWPYNQWQFMRR